MTGMKGIFSIRAGRPFADRLAARLLHDFAGRPEELALALVFLPTRRAVRTLRDAFLRQSSGRALLLPRMVPLGDIDDEESLFDEIGPGEGMAEAAPPIPDLARRLALASLIEEQSWKTGERDALPFDQALKLGGELARLLDQVQTERLSFDRLDRLVPDEYAAHWQITLEFLELVTDQWPATLDRLGFVDPATRREAAVAAQIERWRATQPDHPVIAAGSTGSIPATADLIAAIADLPHGAVILPGLDVHLDEPSWAALGPTHPQYGLKRLLERLSVERDAVADLDTGTDTGTDPRERLLSDALRPAETTDAWTEITQFDDIALDGLTRIDCTDAAEEAAVIALIMRRTLTDEVGDTPADCALVTPDRALARRVATELARWRIGIDDSAGQPLRDTPVGTFLALVLDCVAEQAAPIPLLALFKHPLCAAGRPAASFRSLARGLERHVLRGPRPAPGLAGLAAALDAALDAAQSRAGTTETTETQDELAHLIGWIGELAPLFQPFERILEAGAAPLRDFVAAHIGLAEALAADDRESGAALLWTGEDGEAAASFVADLIDAADRLTPPPARLYRSLFAELIADRVVRPRFGTHPRLAILGPLEARLQHYDVMILGGLNEGSWPPDPAIDPWMGRHMREAFGLPSPERRIGLAAHDFVQASCADRVFWTRAARVDGAPTVPSRWLTRIDTILDAARVERRLTAQEPWRDWARMIDTNPDAAAPVARRPAPKPPVAARPRRLSVSDIERWMRDPYDIYAKHILRLRALDPIDAAADQADYGNVIHATLDRFIAAHPTGPLPDDAPAELLRLGRDAFAPFDAMPGVRAFWWPRFERIAHWFIAHETDRRPLLAMAHAELSGSLEIAGPAGPFKLTARADRIDHMAAGGLEIVDYKTGAVPSDKEVEHGFSPQLPLEAAIAAAGGFEGLAPTPAGALSYWRITGGQPPGEVKSLRAEAATLADEALAGLTDLVARFDDPETPYLSQPRPDQAPKYSDYEHLARIKEWRGGDGSGDGEGGA